MLIQVGYIWAQESGSVNTSNGMTAGADSGKSGPDDEGGNGPPLAKGSGGSDNANVDDDGEGMRPDSPGVGSEEEICDNGFDDDGDDQVDEDCATMPPEDDSQVADGGTNDK